MSDRIVVMNKGAIEQIGTPVEIYENPETTFVARFIGKSSVIPGVVAGGGTIGTPLGDLRVPLRDALPDGAMVECLVRPECLGVVANGGAASGGSVVRGRVKQVAYQGATMELHVAAGGLSLIVAIRAAGAASRPGAPGDEVEIGWSAQDTLVFHDGRRCR